MASPRYGNIFETLQNIAYDYCVVVFSFQIVVRGMYTLPTYGLAHLQVAYPWFQN
jgi:hypothetical protein